MEMAYDESFEFLELFETGEDDVFASFFDFASEEDFVEDGVDLQERREVLGGQGSCATESVW